jgi:hypothetical protein
VDNFLNYARPDKNTLIALDFETTPGNQMTAQGVKIFVMLSILNCTAAR